MTAFAHLPEAVERDAVQVVLCNHHFWGGMWQVQHLGKLCQTFGRALSMHSNSHRGISPMAMAHVPAATPNLTYACDTHYPWQASDEVIEGGRLAFDRGPAAHPQQGRARGGSRRRPARPADAALRVGSLPPTQ